MASTTWPLPIASFKPPAEEFAAAATKVAEAAQEAATALTVATHGFPALPSTPVAAAQVRPCMEAVVAVGQPVQGLLLLRCEG